MPKKPPKLRPDAAEIAYRVMLEATGQAERTPPPGERERNPEAVRRGAKGGKKGGRVRADQLSPDQRSEIARKAATSRWDRRKPQ